MRVIFFSAANAKRDFAVGQNLSSRHMVLVRFLQFAAQTYTDVLVVSEMHRIPSDNERLVQIFADHGYALAARAVKNEQSDMSFGTFIFLRINNYSASIIVLRENGKQDVNRAPMVTTDTFRLIGFHGTLDFDSSDRLNVELDALAALADDSSDRITIVIGDGNTTSERAHEYHHIDRNIIPDDLRTFAGWPTDRLPADTAAWFEQNDPAALFDRDRCISRLDMAWVTAPANYNIFAQVLHPVTFQPFETFQQQMHYANTMPMAVDTISDHFPICINII